MKQLIPIILCIFIGLTALSQQRQIIQRPSQLISQFKNTVTFIGTGDGKSLIGTGFFVGIEVPNGVFLYLVTNKHVIRNSVGVTLPSITIKLNLQDSSVSIALPINESGRYKNVFAHPDSNVDIAIIPITLTGERSFQITHIPVEQFLRKSQFDSLDINIGTEAFFTGLFSAITETKKLNPIFRFGKICLLPEEPVLFFGNKKQDIILIESASFGGNSGSPVLFRYQVNSFSNKVGLGGVIMGGFERAVELEKLATGKSLISYSNMGISAVIPAQYILDVLYGQELTNIRNR